LKPEYFIFKKQGYDKMYWCVAGREISHAEAPMFNTLKEAESYANKLNSEKETINASRSSGEGC